MKLRCSQEDYQLINSKGKAYYHISYTHYKFLPLRGKVLQLSYDQILNP